MQWSTPSPENPWPHDMVIRINDDPHNLTLLLFVRQAWSIAGDLNIPPLNPVPDCGDSRMPESADAATWDQRWKTSWAQAWDWYQIEDPTRHPTPAEMRQSGDASAWASGIDTVIVLPYEGYFVQRLSRRHLIVSAATRNSTEYYSRALRESTP